MPSRGKGRGRGRGQAPVRDPTPPPRSPTPSEAESVVSISDDDEDEISEPLFSPSGRSTIDDSGTPTPSTPTPGGISSISGLRRALMGAGKKKNRPLRPVAYLRHVAWCMHCFRTFLENWDTSEPPVIPCWDDGLSSKRCRQCASRNKNCEPVSDFYEHGVMMAANQRFSVGERGYPWRRDAFAVHSRLGQVFLG